MCPWHEVGCRPPYEHPSGRVIEHDGIACPFEQFAKIVCTCDVLEETSPGQIVFGVSRFAEIAYGVVGLDVGVHTQEEDCKAHPQIPFLHVEHGVQVFCPGKHHYAGTQKTAVHQIECGSHGSDAQWHTAVALEKEGEDSAPVNVVHDVE